MRITAFLGSPRRGGNTELMLKETLEAIEERGGSGHEISTMALNEMKILPCQNCGGCDETGLCIYRDDMDMIYEAIRESDRIILASPIFFFSVSAQAKAMIDRCQSFWCEKYLLGREIEAGPEGRRGLLLLVGGMKRDIGVTASEATAKAFFRTVSVPEHRTVSALGVDAKGAVLERPEVLEQCRLEGAALLAPAGEAG